MFLQSTSAMSEDFISGSNGSFGAIVINQDTTIDLPPDGIIHATTVNINSGRLTFNRNALNTPVYLLATGDIIIDGEISVSAFGRLGGPGGFDGGIKRDPVTRLGPSAGLGPGGSTGDAAYRSNGSSGAKTYGNALLMPIIGGSGGGGIYQETFGQRNVDGGGGGGAIVVASNTAIFLEGKITARGAVVNYFKKGRFVGSGGRGSDGAIRLVSPSITGEGFLQAFSGRTRIDSLNSTSLTISANSIGSLMQVFPPLNPRLDIINAAGNSIPEGSNNEVLIFLPFDALAQQTITVQGRDFTGFVPVEVVVVTESGHRIIANTIIKMSDGNPATATVDIELPLNTPMTVHAWTAY